jgi:hypothetical protein
MSNHYRGSSKDDPYQILIHLAKRFSPLKSLCQMNRNLVGSILGRSSIAIAHLVPNHYKHGRHRQFLFLIGRFKKISSSKTTLPNEPKLSRKHLWRSSLKAKRLQRRRFFRNQPFRNKNCLWRPWLLTDRDEMSNIYTGPSIDASYQGSVYFLSKDCSFRPDQLINMAATGNSCFWLVDI